MSQHNLGDALDELFDSCVSTFRTQYQSLPRVDFEEDWLSKCTVGEAQQGMVQWQPVKRQSLADFSGIEKALEITLHDDIQQFYSRYWSSNFEVMHNEGGLCLLQIWNQQDFERLIENLLGHAFAKMKMKQAFTFFIACPDDPNYLLSVDNETGCVWVEKPGYPPVRKIADSLTQFISELSPNVQAQGFLSRLKNP